MSSTVTESRASSAARTTAQRVADGIVAGYVRALATASSDLADDHPPRLRQRGRRCDEGRTIRPYAGAVAARRQLARQRALLPA